MSIASSSDPNQNNKSDGGFQVGQTGDKMTPPRSPTVPSSMHVSSSPSVAAGVPVLELIRKFEDESILNREDRVSLNDALYNPERRDGIMKALMDVELGTNSRFAIRRLKSLIHQNGTGEVSSKAIKQRAEGGAEKPFLDYESFSPTGAGGKDKDKPIWLEKSKLNQDPAENSGNKSACKAGSPNKASRAGPKPKSDTNAITDTVDAIEQVVGNTPMYANPENFNVCSKIARRLRDFLIKYKPSAMGVRKFAVLIGNGSFNPLTRMHLRSYFVAKQYLETKLNYIVLGSLLSPAHGMTVRERYRTNQSEILPSPHRLAMAQLMVKDSKWLSIDPWEITRRRPMDYLATLEHTAKMLQSHFPQIEIKILYLAKANAVPKIDPGVLKKANSCVVSVCRAPEFDTIRRTLGAKWNGLISCIEDTAVLDASMDIVTSRKVREKVKTGGNVAHLVGDAIQVYAATHHLGAKMTGTEEWGGEELKLPVAHSRPMAVLHDRSVMLSSPTSLASGTSRGTEAYTPSWGDPKSPIGQVISITDNSDKAAVSSGAGGDAGESAASSPGLLVPMLEEPKGIPKSNNDESSVNSAQVLGRDSIDSTSASVIYEKDTKQYEP